jgi:hypothetical protein
MKRKPFSAGALPVLIGVEVRATRPTRPSPNFIRVLWTAAFFSPSVAQSSSVSLSRNR